MNRISFIIKCLALPMALALASCSPTAYTIGVEKRLPSPAGIELGGKSMAVVFLESRDGRDSTFNNALADAFIENLEENYFDGAQGIDLYRIEKDPEGDYASRDSLVNLVMTTGSDVVFLIDTPVLLAENSGALTKIYVYDSMAKDSDSVYMSQNSVKVASLEDKARAAVIGKAMATHYVGKWVEESFPIVYYDLDDSWVDALLYAYGMEWQSAADIWMRYVDSGSAVKRACAEYNLAVSCFVAEEYALAKEWLDRADGNYLISPSTSLREKINEKLGN